MTLHRRDPRPSFRALRPLSPVLALLVAGVAWAQGFDDAARRARADLDSSLVELADLRKQIESEKVPLSSGLRRLERRLTEARGELDDAHRELDSRNLEIAHLETALDAGGQEASYLSSLLAEYVRNFEAQLHISELQRYRDVVDEARDAPEQPDPAAADVYAAQLELVRASIGRLEEIVGGATFEGRAIGADGVQHAVQFALIGPVALYAARDGDEAGLAEMRLGSLEPNMIAFDDAAVGAGARELVRTGRGAMPFDPTLGNARKVEATEETLFEHVQKGGPVMIPILLLALSALTVAFLKWVQVSRVEKASPKRVAALMEAVETGDLARARQVVRAIGGPTGEMLGAGVEHVEEPRDLVEEVMFEKMLETRLAMQSFLPFVAISAAAAPLLGLLGTVTGIINTFKMITVFGTGDAKTLSSGISEALVTTEFGLIVAIPSLLLHAYLSRRSRRLVDGMEKTAISLLNRIPSARSPKPVRTTPTPPSGPTTPVGGPSPAAVAEAS